MKRPRLIGGQYVADAVVWTVALVAAVAVRYDLDIGQANPRWLVALCVVTVTLQLVVGWITFLYRARHPRGSFAEVASLFLTVLVTGALVGVPVLVAGLTIGLPRGTVVIATPLALVGMAAVRYVRRMVSERRVRTRNDAVPVLVYGAGGLGALLIQRMRREPSGYAPVGLIDDDPGKKHLRLHGVPVLGTVEDLDRIVAESGAAEVIVAISRADASLLRRVSDAAARAGVSTKVLPPFDIVDAEQSRLADLRDVSIEDLVGRQPVDTEIETIASYLAGKRVLVTGAGGSIGSELARQIASFSPAELILLDRDESGLQLAQLMVSGRGLLDTKDVVLCDIRDEEALAGIFADRRPEVVFHAAALKHLPMLEQYPDEAWKTNVLGTLNVLRASLAVDVETFVNISTDKAADPTSVLGRSKLLSERLAAWAGKTSQHTYLSVRFGNVLGSRGSLLPTFVALIEAGGPLTVTHQDATRYFMSIPEACQLVVQAGAIGRPGEVLILDMGEPVRILDVATRMIEMSGKQIEIVFTGLRPGEKLHEQLIASAEVDQRPVHPKISHSPASPLAPETLDKAIWDQSSKIRE